MRFWARESFFFLCLARLDVATAKKRECAASGRLARLSTLRYARARLHGRGGEKDDSGWCVDVGDVFDMCLFRRVAKVAMKVTRDAISVSFCVSDLSRSSRLWCLESARLPWL